MVDTETSADSHNYVTIGITSYGEECGVFPGVYQHASQYIEFIQSGKYLFLLSRN